MLEKVNYPEDLRNLNINDKKILAEELRTKIIDTVSKTGGHLASNLGVVELTIALHSIFNTPIDKIVWDVGHQTYVHKMLTGRKNRLETLRQMDGLAGFPKSSESIYDCFNTGHSSTSISIALGMARARDIKKENNKIVAVIGDGALTGGMALEALNDVGSSNTNMLVVLNDNEMSISKNVGGISMMLSKLRTKNLYTTVNIKGKNTVYKIPFIGKKIVHIVQKTKRGIKQLYIPKMYFEDIGFRYLGPVDGHNLEDLESILRIAKNQSGPILVHILTKKGKGYKPAEDSPDVFHSTSKFDKLTGEKIGKSEYDYSKIFGKKLVQIAEKNKNVVAITAAMKDGTGLELFSKKFPDRFFDVGIAEQHAVGLAAGLARSGMVPVVPLYSSFIQRAFDQLIHDVAIMNLPVVICSDRSGIVGQDGETHQGLLDMSFTNIIPNFTIMAPKDFAELEDMLEFAINLKKPVLIRYPKGKEETYFEKHEKIELGKCEVLKKGIDICFIGIGKFVAKAYKVAEKLEQKGIDVTVINSRFLKPLDDKEILNSIKNMKLVITLEDGIIKNGLGDEIEKLIFENSLNCELIKLGYPDKFIKQGTIQQIEKKYDLDDDSVYQKIFEKYEEIKNYRRGKQCLKIFGKTSKD